MSISSTAFPAHGLTLYHTEAIPEPTEYVIFWNGYPRKVTAAPNETPQSLWERTLAVLSELRIAAVRSKSLTPHDAHVEVYAGELEPESFDKLCARAMREAIIAGLNREANDPKGTGTSRTQAMACLSRIYGLERPRRKVV
jgi:hypothetical protein